MTSPSDDEYEIRKPDGTPANPEELLYALDAVTGARPDQMDCPVRDCSGRVEAQCNIWFNVSPEGMPSVYGIGWAENGQVLCTRGGDHVPMRTQRQVWEMTRQFCAALERRLGAVSSDDRANGALTVQWPDEEGEQ